MATEREMLDLLKTRYTQLRYGAPVDRYVSAEHVRTVAGFAWKERLRTADFITLDTYESGGHSLHGHEVKCSRSDWLTELRDPSKAAAFTPYMDYWWLVTSDHKVARKEELPEGWGLMTVNSTGKLKVLKFARKNPATLALPKPMLAALLRAVQKTAQR